MRHATIPIIALALVFAAGCSGTDPDPTAEIWLEGFGYDWELFNHRVSHVEMGVEGDGAWASIIGGTSTTNELTELPDGCDSDTCGEFPFYDYANVRLRWAKVSTADVVFARGRVELLATADGDTKFVLLDLPRPVEGDVTAVIAGLSIDTDFPLAGGESCYDPRLGWHPRRIAVALTDPALDAAGGVAEVQVSASFEAGESLEDERVCIDDVNDQAQVPVIVDVVVLAGTQYAASSLLTTVQSFDYGDGPMSPDEQPPPPAQNVDAGDVVGITGLDWRFHEDDAEDRGAYIRSLDIDVDTAAGQAVVWASNYSPGTQLSGFDYSVTVDVTALTFDPATTTATVVTRGSIAEQLDVELTADGTPVVYSLDL